MTEICVSCGQPSGDWICEACQRSGVVDAARPAVADDLERMVVSDAPGADLDELDVRRFARLAPSGRFMVGILMRTWRRDGADGTLADAIRQVEEVERRRAERGE